MGLSTAFFSAGAQSIDPKTTCADVCERALAKDADIEQKIQTLQAIKVALTHLAAACSGEGPASSCPLLEALEGQMSVVGSETCRQGASVIQNEVLNVVPDRGVSAYVVWVPILSGRDGVSGRRGDRARSQVPPFRPVAPSPRPPVSPFWDAEGRLLALFKKTRGLEQKRRARSQSADAPLRQALDPTGFMVTH